MPFSNPPFTPVAGDVVTLNNPAQSSGTGQTPSASVVIANNSPYVLEVASGSGSGTGVIYPFTRDIIPLNLEGGQQVVITPVDIGVVAPSTVLPIVYVTWYQGAEPTPENLPISLGNTSTTSSVQQVLLGTATAADPPPGEIIIPTNPLWRSIWVLLIGSGMVGPPVCQGASGAFYEASTPPYLVNIPGEQLFYRFNIIPAAEDEVGLSMVIGGVDLYYWGADLADTDVLAYDQSGGGVGDMANAPDPLRFSYAGDLVAGTSDDTDIPGGFVDCPIGSTAFITRLWGLILGGTSVDVTVRVNSAPAYTGPVDVPDLTGITITTTPGGFILPTALQVFDLDYVDIVLTNLVGTPAGLAALTDVVVVP